MKKAIIFFTLVSILAPAFSFAQIEPPKDLEESKALIEKGLEVGEKELPGIFKQIWQENVLPIWKKMWNWFNAKIWSRIWPLAEKEIEKRKPFIEEEFEKEKQEVKEEAPKIGKSLWEKFKEIIR